MNKQEVLQQCTVDGVVVKLPDVQLDRKLYLEVKQALELIGGKWKSGKVSGFIFANDPTELLASIANGESRNIKKEFQFFPTPEDLADELVELALIQENHTVLEPSAGQGAIVKSIAKIFPEKRVACFELMETNRLILDQVPNAWILGEDFMDRNFGFPLEGAIDRIIANPPFSKNQDIDHIQEMYKLLKSGGILVSMASTHWVKSQFKKETEFREWLTEVSAEIIEVEAGRFKESGTNVPTCIIRIEKL